MKSFISVLMATAAIAAPVVRDAATPVTAATPATYTAAINAGGSDPPPVWDPPTPPAPPLFEVPKEDIPWVPSWLVSVHEAPVQAVRVEKLSAFTPNGPQPVDNIYRPSQKDDEAKFNGEGSLRPAQKTVTQSLIDFGRAWIWWISIIVLAVILVYIAEKMLIGSVRAARKARSASRVARSRAASLMQGTRSRAASLLGDGGRSRAGTLKELLPPMLERSRSPPPQSQSWDKSMA